MVRIGCLAAVLVLMGGAVRAQDVPGIELPLFVQDRAMRPLLEDSHKIIAYLLAALVAVHVAGALRHHFVKRNTVLRRMTVGIKT